MKIKITKPYIIEGEIIPKGTEISTLEESSNKIAKLFKQLNNDLSELFNLFDNYIMLFHKDDFSEKLELNEEQTKEEKDLLDAIKRLIQRIKKDIESIIKALAENKEYDDIDEANSNLTDLVGTYTYLVARFNNLKSNDSDLRKTFETLVKLINDLNSKIKEYNNTSKKQIYTIEKAIEEFFKNTPKP